MRKACIVLGILAGAVLAFVLCGGVSAVDGWMNAQGAAVAARTSLPR